MKIITTPMCEDVLKIAGLNDYTVVKPNNIKDADIAILLSETKSTIPKLSIKLNTFDQILISINLIEKKFNTEANKKKIDTLKKLIEINNTKKDNRKNTKVKVYGNFLKDTVLDMGYTVDDNNYDFIVMPDYMKSNLDNDEKIIIIPSHKNVSNDIIQRITERYELLEQKLCMKQ